MEDAIEKGTTLRILVGTIWPKETENSSERVLLLKYDLPILLEKADQFLNSPKTRDFSRYDTQFQLAIQRLKALLQAIQTELGITINPSEK